MSTVGWVIFGWFATAPVILLVLAFVAARRTNREFARVVEYDDWRRSYVSTKPTSPRAVP